jgi:hypothetical protein
MPRLKYFNQTTQQWEYAVVGGQGPQGEIGVGLPTGGLAGMILSKQSSDDYDIEWIIPPSGGGGSITTSDTKPLFPNDGDLWYDTADGLAYVYYDDGVGTLTTRTNLVTNPSFETNITGWVGLLDTPEQSSTYSFVGTKSLKMNPVESGDYVSFSNIPVTAGEVYTVSAYIYTDTSKSVNIAVTGGDSTVTIPAGVWTRISASSTIPEFTTTATVFITSFSDDTIPFYIDAVMLEQSSTLNEYFDGSTAGASWTGTAHASTSTLSVSSGNSAQWVELKSSASVSSEVDVRLSNAEADIDDIEAELVSLDSEITSVELSTIKSQNHIINGAFDIWQRGTSAASNISYLADRWLHLSSAGLNAVFRDEDVPENTGLIYSLCFISNNGTNPSIIQRIESSNSINIAGRTVTLSLWAKSDVGTAGLTWSTATPSSIDTWTGSDTDQSGTFAASMTVGEWTRYSATFTVTATASTGYQIVITRSATATSTTTYFTGIQLEEGPAATPFRRNAPSIQAELAACQRYYWIGGNSATGVMNNATSARFSVQYPVTMRSAPTIRIEATPRALNPTVSESQTNTAFTTYGQTLSIASGGVANSQSASKINISSGWASGADGRVMTLLNDCFSFDAEL